MKIWISIAIAGLAMGCDPTLGGPCEYDDIDVEAEVIEFEPGDDTWGTCAGTPKFGLRMIDIDSGDEVFVYGLRVGLDAPAATLEAGGLTLGSTHRIQRSLITSGTCSPEITEFVDSDVDFDQVTCASDRR